MKHIYLHIHLLSGRCNQTMAMKCKYTVFNLDYAYEKKNKNAD